MARCISNIVKAFLFFCFYCLVLRAQSSVPSANQDVMVRGFANPPNSARPRVWWHWMNGNISEEGIQLDLEWMSHVGIGGVTIFEGSLNTPQVVQRRLIYKTPEWKEAFSYAVSTARTLGLEVSIASSPGWSETGGPWVPPAQAMKKMVWSATRVEGGRSYSGILPLPPMVIGTFQSYGDQSFHESNSSNDKAPLAQFYADSAVVAYRIPADDKTQAELSPSVTSSGGAANVAALSDGDVNKVALSLPTDAPGEKVWVQFGYGRPQTIQAITLATLDDIANVFYTGSTGPSPILEASDDGQHFRKIVEILPSSIPQRTTAFDAVTARYFRLSFATPSSPHEGKIHGDHRITELVLSSGARINEFEKRAGFSTVPDYYAIPDPVVAPGYITQRSDVIDLTSKMKTDGSLDWIPPTGKWVILRIGYSLTGRKNGPAPVEATGLEVDKLNRQYVKNYLDSYLKTYSDTVGSSRMGKSGIAFMLSDSIEAGAQNWSDDILNEFKLRRGYDPYLWLPALTGVVIQSPKTTDRFLWDFRRTIAELIAQNHYGEISEQLHRRGMGYYAEALENRRPSLGDDMEMRSNTDIPMGAMHMVPEGVAPEPNLVDLQGAASIAHIYGQNLVGAESFTSSRPPWIDSPASLKRIADLAFALGANRFMIHESTHQPLVGKAPGLTLGRYGQMFNRNETWANEAGPWITYLSRCSYLLQQGHFYGDVAYFYGEEGPLTGVFSWKPQQDAPQGYGFDFVNRDVIMNHLSVRNGRLVTRTGLSYRILYLGGTSQRMTLPVLRRLSYLVAEGAVIVGSKPTDSPSLADDETEFHTIASQLWGSEGKTSGSVRNYGKGKVYFGMTANEVLADLRLAPDFKYTRPEPDTTLMFLHRKLINGDIYFVDNRKSRPETLDVSFRMHGKTPELWDAVTGVSESVSYRITGELTTISLHLDSYGTVFVVFRKPAVATSRQLPQPVETVISNLEDSLNQDWRVRFQSGRGAPEKLELDHLSSWTENPNDGVKYFSGTAMYTKTILVSPSWFKPGAHLWLDLGDVENLAEVTVNEKYLGIAWKVPFKVDITDAIKPGSNQLMINVTNLWVNRLIGDQQPNAAKKYTFTDIQPYKPGSLLLPSGLLGPLRILSVSSPLIQ